MTVMAEHSRVEPFRMAALVSSAAAECWPDVDAVIPPSPCPSPRRNERRTNPSDAGVVIVTSQGDNARPEIRQVASPTIRLAGMEVTGTVRICNRKPAASRRPAACALPT